MCELLHVVKLLQFMQFLVAMSGQLASPYHVIYIYTSSSAAANIFRMLKFPTQCARRVLSHFNMLKSFAWTHIAAHQWLQTLESC